VTIIGPAVLSDVPELCELLAILFSQEAEFTPDVTAQFRGLSEIISHQEIGHVLVTRDDGRIVAMVSLLYTVSTAPGGKVALLEDMVVAPDLRGRGVGSLLLQRTVEFAHAQGCSRVTLLTDRINESAQRFYKRHGFMASPMIPLRLVLH
jgi:GNAT superfamily N-acetyltransferase